MSQRANEKHLTPLIKTNAEQRGRGFGVGVSLSGIFMGRGKGSGQLPWSHFSLSEGKNRAALATAGGIEARLQNETSRAGGPNWEGVGQGA